MGMHQPLIVEKEEWRGTVTIGLHLGCFSQKGGTVRPGRKGRSDRSSELYSRRAEHTETNSI